MGSGQHRLRLRVSDVVRFAVAWAVAALALGVADALLPGMSSTSPWGYLAVAAISGVIGLVIRPVLVEVSARIGWLAVLLVGLAGQALVMYLAILAVPAITADFWTAVVASWVVAAVGTVVAWAATAGTDDGLVTSLRRRGRRNVEVSDPEVDGVVFVQLDGTAFPVLRWAVQAGAVPTIRRWLASGDYELREWTPQLPCTTPASQLGILHGTVDRVPAFRWYDREVDRVLVANRPADARVIEDRASNGQGLLWDDGVSISNLFTGDAPRSFMTMSRVEVSRGTAQTRRAVAWFLATPGGFMRSLNRTIAEIVKERWQAGRQVRRDVDPRVHRGWTFAILRAVTNALLRDLNTALVAEEMRRGARSIYVDYVDYDEIAHHAGMFRPESLASLDGLDQVLASLERLAEGAARRYRIVVLSDHGQSQGRTFKDRYGKDLGGVCQELMAQQVRAIDAPVEGWGRAASIIDDVGSDTAVTGRLVDRADRRIAQEYDDQGDQPGEDAPIVLGSGNLGLFYLQGPHRRTLEELSSRWPRLVPGLAGHPGVGFVAGIDQAGIPWVIGAKGRRNLRDGAVEGRDPLAQFGEHAPRVLLRALSMDEAPDLYVNSSVDPWTADVAAFEELVGAHGGLGGYQDSALLLVPSDLVDVVPDRIEGADRLHEVLVAMLERCGQRTGRQAPATGAELPKQRIPEAPRTRR
jgi:uncharacterized membrane protein YvlD (DUF360 family)